jgi:hypothetical protein
MSYRYSVKSWGPLLRSTIHDSKGVLIESEWWFKEIRLKRWRISYLKRR